MYTDATARPEIVRRPNVRQTFGPPRRRRTRVDGAGRAACARGSMTASTALGIDVASEWQENVGDFERIGYAATRFVDA